MEGGRRKEEKEDWRWCCYDLPLRVLDARRLSSCNTPLVGHASLHVHSSAALPTAQSALRSRHVWSVGLVKHSSLHFVRLLRLRHLAA